MKPEQADQILLALKAAYPHADSGLDAQQAKDRDAVYRRALLTWGSVAAQEAVTACILRCKFYPTVAELYAAYTDASRGNPPPVASVLPKPGDTVASPDDVKAACAAAVAAVDANVNVSAKPRSTFSAPASADPEEERDMIQRTIAKTRSEDA
jgi:hypothetical protein